MTTGPRFFIPDGTEVIHRLYSPAEREHALVIGLLVPFELTATDGQSSGATAAPLWERIQGALASDELFDEGWPKVYGEFLAAGACHVPPGHTDQPVSARVMVGEVDKRLAIFGDRHVQVGGRFSRPEPFVRMPLGLAQAFGGPTHAHNPQGKGLSPDEQGIIALPNVEHPDHLMLSASDQPPVASFAPLPAALPQRVRYLGDQGEAWLASRWPHLPLDTDARFFQAAPSDQWHSAYWQGGEAIRVLNMHPRFPELQGRVPTVRTRLFAHQIDPQREAHFHELKVGLDTVWLLPEACLGVAIYRALLPTNLPNAHDVGAVLAAMEPAGQPPETIEHYLQQCLVNLGGALLDAPPEVVTPNLDTLSSLSPAELLAQLETHRQQFHDALAQAGTHDEQLLETLENNPETRRIAEMIRLNGGTMDGFFAEIEKLLNHEEPPPPASVVPNDLRAAYEPPQPARHAPTMPAARAPAVLDDPAMGSRHRQQVIALRAQGASCAGLDLAQANLAGLDLTGQDFSGALLTGANFSGATLQGALFNDAHLTDARFDGADLRHGQLSRASLSTASFCGARLQGARLDDSDCSQADFSDAALAQASLRGTVCHGAWLKGIAAEGLAAERAQFDHANLEGADLTDARLDGASFSGAQMRNARLSGASCVAADLSLADLSLADLTGVDLSDSQASEGTALHRARLDGATLRQVSWMGAALEHATLTAAVAEQADLSSCNLQGVVMTAADLTACCFDYADLSRANLSRANLLSSSFIGARLSHAWLEHTNLYGATFVDSALDGVRLTGANLEKTALAGHQSR